MIEDPWSNLPPSDKTDVINARRVDPNLPFGFFWAKGLDRKCLLLLQHSTSTAEGQKLPQLKGIDVSTASGHSHGHSVLALRLQDSSQRELFHRLCLDIVTYASAAASEDAALAAVLSRTWRWHHLLRGGGDSRLTSEEQKGLLGEFTVLGKLLQRLSPSDSVRAWRGPLGAPKDFEIGQVAIEAKARRGGATPYVSISSEHQLDASGTEALILFVLDVDRAPSDDKRGSTITDVARSLQTLLIGSDPTACGQFEGLLSSAGFRWEDDYSDSKWLMGRERLFRIAPGFPSITPDSFPPGVVNVKYSLSLGACEPFAVEAAVLNSLLSGHVDA